MTPKHFLLLLLLLVPVASAQSAAQLGAVERASAGDSPSNPGPLATDLSPALTHKDIRAAMKKVADWQVATGEKRFNQQWTFAALYDGLLAYSKETGDPVGHDAVLRMAEGFKWQLVESRFPHADDQHLGYSYEDLYIEHPDPVRIAATKNMMDRLVARKDEAKPVWWWCDALYMAPPVLVRMSKITGDRKYIDYMDHEWDVTKALLYVDDEHLYFRDATFLQKTEANGKKLFWSRGNGWVLAGLGDDPQRTPRRRSLRPKYETQFKEMATKIASLQGPTASGAPACSTPQPTSCPKFPAPRSSRTPWPMASTTACSTARPSLPWSKKRGPAWSRISTPTVVSAPSNPSAPHPTPSSFHRVMSTVSAASCWPARNSIA